jgi:hypothetical protein
MPRKGTEHAVGRLAKSDDDVFCEDGYDFTNQFPSLP